MSTIGNIKNKVSGILTNLVNIHVLGSFLNDDFRGDIFSRDIPSFPCAIISNPSIETSISATNQDNLRTYTFEILIVEKGENIAGTTDMEDLMEAIIDTFDNDPTLTGSAEGGVDPAVSPTISVSSADKTYLLFVITIKPKTLYTRS